MIFSLHTFPTVFIILCYIIYNALLTITYYDRADLDFIHSWKSTEGIVFTNIKWTRAL